MSTLRDLFQPRKGGDKIAAERLSAFVISGDASDLTNTPLNSNKRLTTSLKRSITKKVVAP